MCYYDILGIKAGATATEIKRAYYEKVKLFHPDHNQTSTAEESFKIVARAYEVLRDPTKRKCYDSDKAANRGHTSSDGHSNYDYDTSKAQGQTHRTKKTANPGSHTAYSEFYKSYGAEQNSANEKYEYTGTWQDYYNHQRAEETMRQKYYQEPRAAQRNSSFFDSMIVKVGLIVVSFLTFEVFMNQKKAGSTSGKDYSASRDPKSLGQMDWGTHTGEMMSPQKIQEEMKKKQFRIEYHMVDTIVSPEAARARKTYKKEKKIVDLDEYMVKKNFIMEKSRAQHA